ncbi:hypothetical protein E3P89_01936 [Wallemia ichthyophaga]|uniref:Velvet domain-containing protein n=1 Tax=Wallemia ichthyophaga TaxID=245174 RepID=A0A4T0IBX6_WALIC|nr:hypothetical protein E3P93_02537 [Wallemia ichthyophaga]TIB11936.1 hypothetical protein E3P90_02229 [Wallemia ichthyophaga]TIB22724.1 hypothetical protein E3P89_01936 [Wallemia ichthyophaga]TIB24125.1 hypothetical protein E3P88_02185 [Wallemia ichthyophaga]
MNLTYDLSMRQQPKHSRMCGVGSKADRRPIDPPPIVQLKVFSHHNSLKMRQDLSFNHLQSPYFFVYCSLASEHSDHELHLLSETKTRYTTGNVTSSVYCLRDLDLSEVLVAVFPDVSVRVEGRFRLKFSLFEISNSKTFHRKSLFSNPFTVFSAKRFPGMDQSTELSQCLANQGLKIRIRRDNRRDRRKSSKRYYEDDDDVGGSNNSGHSAPTTNSPPHSPALNPNILSYPSQSFKRPLAPLPSRLANIPPNTAPFNDLSGGSVDSGSGSVQTAQTAQTTQTNQATLPHTHNQLTLPTLPTFPSLANLPTPTLPLERSASSGQLGPMLGRGVQGAPVTPATSANPITAPTPQRIHSTPTMYRPHAAITHAHPPPRPPLGHTHTQPTSSVHQRSNLIGSSSSNSNSNNSNSNTDTNTNSISTSTYPSHSSQTGIPPPPPKLQTPPSLAALPSLPSLPNLPRIQLPPIRDLIKPLQATQTQPAQPAQPAQPQPQSHTYPQHTPPFNPSNFKPPNQR